MTTLRQAAQQALEAYDQHEPLAVVMGDLRFALRAALTEPLQEPVAWMYEHDGMVHDALNPPIVAFNRWSTPVGEPYTETPLYTAPPQRKPLTEEEISNIWDGHVVPVFGKNGINPIVFARAIERAHGIT